VGDSYEALICAVVSHWLTWRQQNAVHPLAFTTPRMPSLKLSRLLPPPFRAIDGVFQDSDQQAEPLWSGYDFASLPLQLF
jgi:hypothetical protein